MEHIEIDVTVDDNVIYTCIDSKVDRVFNSRVIYRVRARWPIKKSKKYAIMLDGFFYPDILDSSKLQFVKVPIEK